MVAVDVYHDTFWDSVFQDTVHVGKLESKNELLWTYSSENLLGISVGVLKAK